MKFKVSLFLSVLILLTSGIVSAEDNATFDNLTDISDEIEVTFDEQMWQENLTDINVELPENSTGEFAVKIDNEVIYNQTITEKSFKVPIKLPDNGRELYIAIWPPIDCRNYKVSAFYNNIDLNINKTLKIMKYSPDYNLLHFPGEILHNEKYSTLLAFPRSANGEVEFYIDDKLFNRTAARPTFYWNDNPFSKLPPGKHTFKVIYCGDNYYHAYNRTFNFTVTDVVIDIPEVIEIGHDDCISVRTLENIQGNVKVYLDNKLIANSDTEDGDFILSLEEYLKYTNREIKVVYTSNNFSRTKIQPVNMTYDMEVWNNHFIYGASNVLEIYLPDTFNNNLLKTSINGKQYSFKRSTLVNNVVELDISDFYAGNYTLEMYYPGDGKYYEMNKTASFIINYGIHIPEFFHYGSEAKVYLNLPKNASGSLAVYADGKYFNSSQFTNGYAEVKIASMDIGRHEILAFYNGTDYNVTNQSYRVYESFMITFDWKFTAGEDKYITVEFPKSRGGYVIFDIDGKSHKVAVKNGIAKYSLKNLKVGDHEIYIDYYGDDGFTDLSNWVSVTVLKPKFKVILAKANFKGISIKIKLLTKKGKVLAGKYVKIKFNGKTYKIRTDKKGIVTFKKSAKLKNRKYVLKITYMGFKFTKKIKAKALDLKKTETKKKLTVKAAINKKVKGKTVVIKVNSKKYSVKTNKSGIAKLTVKKPKKFKIKATYLKDTVAVV